jgi:leucyl/phenylalanyl-tRNA--protein transferase
MNTALPWLDPDELWFPDPATALRHPNGLLAAGGDLRPERLLLAYQLGIFPWYEADQPPLWWSPDPRMVLFPHEVHVSRSMQKFLRRHPYTLRSDTAFSQVMQLCGSTRAEGTWISPAMLEAYHALHQLGHAHSVEVWEGGELVGGLYGVALGRMFFGESMFSLRPNVSKLALIDLATRLPTAGYHLIDCQVANPHLASLGARNLARSRFRQLLPTPDDIGKPAPWPYNSPGSAQQLPEHTAVTP